MIDTRSTPTGVKCGNRAQHGHDTVVYHSSPAAVRECYALSGRFAGAGQPSDYKPVRRPAAPSVWHSTGRTAEEGHWEAQCPGTSCPVTGLTSVSVEDAVAQMRANMAAEEIRKADASRARYASWRSIPVEASDYANYALVNSSGEVSFYRVRRPSTGQYAGRTYVDLYVSDETVRMPWEQSANVLDRIAADPLAAAVLYGQETKRCAICHRKLTQTESRERGIGPKCAAKVGRT